MSLASWSSGKTAFAQRYPVVDNSTATSALPVIGGSDERAARIWNRDPTVADGVTGWARLTTSVW
jgi:hypothetical protein